MAEHSPGTSFGIWWKASKYEIRNGSIQPTADAELKPYKPWGRLKRPPGSRVSQTPFTELVNLGKRLRECIGGDGELLLDAGAERDILSWCKRYGLLGLLPHGSRFAVIELTLRERGWMYMLREVDRWTRWMDVAEFRKAEGLGEPEWKEACVLVERYMGPPGIEPLNDVWAPFFPREDPEDWGVLDAPPLPLSDEFWDRYSEPVDQFAAVAERFAHAVTVATRHRPGPGRREALGYLNRLISSSSPVLEKPKQGAHQLHWRSPSLLGMLALMAVQSVLGEQTGYFCDCGAMFMSSDPRAQYCCPKHREQYRKRRQRAKASKAADPKGRRSRPRRRSPKAPS